MGVKAVALGGKPSLTFFLFALILKASCGKEESFAQVVQSFMDDIIGVDTFQTALNRARNIPKNLDSERIVLGMEERISRKLLRVRNAVEKLRFALVANETNADESMPKYKCCSEESVEKTWNESCWQSNSEYQTVNLPLDKMLKAAGENQGPNDLLKLQRYVDKNGVIVHHPIAQGRKFCDSPHATNFASSILSLPKDFVLAVDSNLFASDLDRTLDALGKALSMITASDYFAVFAFSAEVSVATVSEGPVKCPRKKMILGSQRNKDVMFAWLKSQTWQPEQLADYEKAFEAAFDYFDSMDDPVNKGPKAKILALVTSSASKSNQKEAFQVMARRNARNEHQATVLTYDLTAPIAQTALLTAFANQNGENYGVPKVETAIEGKYIRVDNMDQDFRDKLGLYFEYVSQPRPGEIRWGWPHHYPATDIGMIITASQAVNVDSKFKGVISADVSVERLVEDAVNGLTKDNDVYAFVVSHGLKVISHPYLSRPTSRFYPDMPVLDLRNFEPSNDLDDLQLSRIRNSSTVTVSMKATWKNHAATTGTGFELHNSTISCRSTKYAVFAVCVVVKSEPASEIRDQVIPVNFKFQYHRLDLLPRDNECKHAWRVSFKGSSVYLTPDAFIDSDRYINEKEDEDTIKKYIEDIKDKKGLVLTTRAVQDVLLTFTLENHWQSVEDKMQEMDIGTRTLWKYVGTKNGVLRVWPGVQLQKNYDYRRAPWYVDAISNQEDKFVITTPYIDVGSGKWIVSFSRSIRFPTSSGKNEVYAVIGFDMLLHDVEEFFASVDERCRGFCTLTKSSGFVIYHPDMISKNSDFKSHLTEFEPTLSGYLMRNKILKRATCFQQETSKFYNYLQFDLGQLPYFETDMFKVTKVEGTNVIFVHTEDIDNVQKWKDWKESCLVKLRSRCRNGVQCQSPCTERSNTSCDYLPNESIDVIAPCRTFFEFWKVDHTADHLDDCYKHFDEGPAFNWLGSVLQGAFGLIVALSCFIGKSFYLKNRRQTNVNNVVAGDGTLNQQGVAMTENQNFGTPPPLPPQGMQPVNQWDQTEQPQGFGFSQPDTMFTGHQNLSNDTSGQYKSGFF